MTKATEVNLDDDTIRQIGLQQTDEPINAQIAPDARVFRYPFLDDVFVMESDLYGNTMPKGSCFLAFNGRNGLIGTHIRVDTLTQASVEEIKKIVASHSES